jgi:hypothetical protein
MAVLMSLNRRCGTSPNFILKPEIMLLGRLLSVLATPLGAFALIEILK